jgi:hypothetical protein
LLLILRSKTVRPDYPSIDDSLIRAACLIIFERMKVDSFDLDLLRGELDSIVQNGLQFFKSAKVVANQRKIELAAQASREEDPLKKAGFIQYPDDWDLLDEQHKNESRNLVQRVTLFAPRLMQAVELSPLIRDEQAEIRLALRSMTTTFQLRYLTTMPAALLNSGEMRVEHTIDADTAVRFFKQEVESLREKMELLSPPPDQFASKIVASQTPNVQKYRPNTAFLMMRIDKRLPRLEDVNNAIKEVFKEFGIEAVRADEIEHSDSITQKILDEIATSEFTIADLTGERPSVYYEVGYAHALGKRPILYREEGTKLHFDLSVNNVPEYRNTTDLKSQLRKRLEAMTNKKGLIG